MKWRWPAAGKVFEDYKSRKDAAEREARTKMNLLKGKPPLSLPLGFHLSRFMVLVVPLLAPLQKFKKTRHGTPDPTPTG